MVASIYFTTPDDFASGHLVELKDKWFRLDESNHFVPADTTRMRLRNGLPQDGISTARVITFLNGF